MAVAAMARAATHFRLALKVCLIDRLGHADHLPRSAFLFLVILIPRPLWLVHVSEVAFHAEGRIEILHGGNQLIGRCARQGLYVLELLFHGLYILWRRLGLLVSFLALLPGRGFFLLWRCWLCRLGKSNE